jgi:hypothetical protein
MPDNRLAKKLKLLGRKRAAVINAPAAYLNHLAAPKGVEMSQKLIGEFDWIQLFVKSRSDLEKIVDKVVAALEPDSILWISFPKGTSGVQTDLTRDKGWESLRRHDLKWITLVSVNDTWSAFAMRPLKSGEKSEGWR